MKMSRSRGERALRSFFLATERQLPPSASHCDLWSRAPKQRLVWANEGLFPSGTFVFLAEEAVNRRSAKKPTSAPVFVCVSAALLLGL